MLVILMIMSIAFYVMITIALPSHFFEYMSVGEYLIFILFYEHLFLRFYFYSLFARLLLMKS
ncbi:MAG: hypothetical protein ACK4M9_21590, partial [Anaerobacillus sp.]|uniref:hypothetical protein n=1 Tax=Anaerobacillus sp. TaxID=1872506 RepID=UPI00391BAD28